MRSDPRRQSRRGRESELGKRTKPKSVLVSCWSLWATGGQSHGVLRIVPEMVSLEEGEVGAFIPHLFLPLVEGWFPGSINYPSILCYLWCRQNGLLWHSRKSWSRKALSHQGEPGVGGWGHACMELPTTGALRAGAWGGWHGAYTWLLQWFPVLLHSIKHLCSYTLIYALDHFLEISSSTWSCSANEDAHLKDFIPVTLLPGEASIYLLKGCVWGCLFLCSFANTKHFH